ncbi:MAG: hypothetical protein HYW07_08090 [Candidatus Latescibacteria bacterium]|nr:hypothetical protein [Candidatus Latescibacterota bacterium]
MAAVPDPEAAMTSGDQLDIRPNLSNGCYEAWLMDSLTMEKRLVSTCSLCVPEDQFRWWNRQVWNVLLPTAA